MFPKQLIYFLRKKGQGPWILTAEGIHLIRLLKNLRRIYFICLASEFQLLNFLTNEKQLMKLPSKQDKHNVKC